MQADTHVHAFRSEFEYTLHTRNNDDVIDDRSLVVVSPGCAHNYGEEQNEDATTEFCRFRVISSLFFRPRWQNYTQIISVKDAAIAASS